ncbi:MAG: hypothetical protein IPL47_10980 [Phyllobacteriaceae bacterium]|nr:hypothetical protein [Phyllobacteriaceae bacterium]
MIHANNKDVSAEVLETFDAGWFSKDIYGDSLNSFKSIYESESNFLTTFAYDWRQDNRISARSFHDWLCNNTNKYNGRSIEIIAHSMGGLIIKYWIKHYYIPKVKCFDGSEPPNFFKFRVNFVGTPNYGAPKALRVFASGFNISRDGGSSSLFGQYIDSLDRNILAKAINEYGFSFSSAYQLLPIYKEKCFEEKYNGRVLDAPAVFHKKLGNNIEAEYGDIFSPDLWRAMKWPTGSRAKIPEDYYSVLLPKYLESAYNFLCETATYPIPENILTRYFVGSSFKTENSYLGDPDKNGTIGATGLVEGDGTVPFFIASNYFAENSPTVVRLDKEYSHALLLKSELLWDYMRDALKFAEIATQKSIFSNGNDPRALASAYKKNNIVPFYVFDTSDKSLDEFQNALVANVFKQYNYDPIQLYRFARTTKDNDIKIGLYTSTIEIAKDTNPKLAATAGNDLTHLLLQKKRYYETAVLANGVKESSYWNKLNGKEIKEIGKYLSNTEGWARLEIGESGKARALFDESLRYGNNKAKIGLSRIPVATSSTYPASLDRSALIKKSRRYNNPLTVIVVS